MEKAKKLKSFLAVVMAVAVAFTTVFASNVTTTYAASGKSVKSITVKVGNSNVTKKTKSLYVGTKATLKVTTNPGTAKKSVAFKSGNSAVAAVSKKGVVTAKKAGSAKITVTVTGKDDKKKSTYVNIKVKNRAVKKVTLDVTEATLSIGETKTLKATVTPTNATNKTVTWSSSKTAVATVSSTGVVKAVKEGTAIITAKSGSKSASCVVTVAPAGVQVSGVSLDTDAATVFVNATQKLTATVTPADATNKSVTWSSDNEAVATVSADGVVKGISEGKANITVTTAEGGFTATAVITVAKDTSGNASDVKIIIANSLEKYENTVLTGTNADVKVLVTNAAGAPLGNTSVTLEMEPQYGNAKDVFVITGDNNNYVSAKLTTDANGYADFTIGEKGGYTYTSTDSIFQSYKLTATVTGSNVKTESSISFACIYLEGVQVENNRFFNLADLEPGENVNDVDWNYGVADTYSTNGARDDEYVNSQKVSAFEEDGTTYKYDHRVYLTATPSIVLPAKNADTQIDRYYKDIKKSSTDYKVYNDATNTDTTAWVEDVPAGLQYASLVFSKMVLSKYTVLEINTYDAVSGGLIETYSLDETNMKDDFAYQIPIQEDTAVDVEVALISEGQVNEDSNDGFVIDHVEGLYKTDVFREAEVVELPGTVKWEKSPTYYSEYMEMPFDTAKTYIKDANYLSTKYTYVYEVPVFPNTGDAVIKITDENGKIVSYFLYPTENQWENPDGSIYPTNTKIKNINGQYRNKNDISLPSKYVSAVKASEEEVTQTVGELTQEGNVAIVDSLKSGRTNLKATITIPGVTERQLNPTNGSELYTSVQWAPIPENELEVAGDDFYALASQYVTVKAQLYDLNGNKVSTQNKDVKFTLSGDELKNPVQGTVDDNVNVTIQQKETKTNEQGQAIIRFTSSSSKGHVYHLAAECQGYIVKLLVGKSETVSDLANIYWITPGLSFTDKIVKGASKGEKPAIGTTTTTLTGAQTVAAIDERKVGNNWIFGYKVIGDLDDDNDKTEKEVSEIKNIAVQMSKSDDTDMTMTTEGYPNGAALVYTEKVGSSKIIGEIGNDSFKDNGSDVIFTIIDALGVKVGDFVNIGEEAPSVSAKLELTVSWKQSGKKVDIIYPQGNLLSAVEDSYAYIRVLDDFGNPIQNEAVKYSITGINATSGSIDAKTDANGLVKVKLAAPGTSVLATDSTIISVDVDGTVINGNMLYYKTTTDAQFGLVGASLDATNTENPQIKLSFSSAVNKEVLNKEMFAVKSSKDDVNYDIENVKIGNNNNIVILTLKSSSKGIIDDTGVVTVTVKDYVSGGITYKLVDGYGRSIVQGYETATFQPKTAYKITVEKSADNKTITVTVKDSSDNAATGKIVAYSSSADVLGGTGITTKNLNTKGIAKFTVTPGTTETSIYFYYNGASESISVKEQ